METRLTVPTRFPKQPVKRTGLASISPNLRIDLIGLCPPLLGCGDDLCRAALFDCSIAHNATGHDHTSPGEQGCHLNSKPCDCKRHQFLHLSQANQPIAANTMPSPTATRGSVPATPSRPFHAPTFCTLVVSGAVGAGMPLVAM